MTTTQNRPPTDLAVRPARTGPRRRSKGDQSLGVLLTVYAVVLVITALLAGFLVEITRSAS